MLTGEQIELRNSGIGGSDAAVVAGIGRITARQLFHVKRGELAPETVEDDLLVWLGHEMEPVLAKLYAKETGRKVQRVNQTQLHGDLPWMIAHPDRRIVADGNSRGLEIKTRVRADGWGPPGSDQVPDDVLLQCQHYMEVMGWELWDVIVLIGGHTQRIYTIPRDRTLADRLVDLGGEFMHRIAVNDPPEIDYEHTTANKLIDVLHPQTDGCVVDLPAEVMAWREVQAKAEEQRKHYDAVIDATKAHVKHLMGEASVGMLPDGAMYKRAERSTTRMNGERSHYIALSYAKARKPR